MGNQQAKKGEQLPFTADELKVLEHSFRHTAGGHTEKITENKLLVSSHMQHKTSSIGHYYMCLHSIPELYMCNVTVSLEQTLCRRHHYLFKVMQGQHFYI